MMMMMIKVLRSQCLLKVKKIKKDLKAIKFRLIKLKLKIIKILNKIIKKTLRSNLKKIILKIKIKKLM